jgi:hypothetical protein
MRAIFFAVLSAALLSGCEARQPSAPSTEPATPVTTSSSAPANAPSPELPRVEGPKLPPVDEGTQDASFAAYRAELVAAVRARDAERVAALSDPDIRLSFGGDGGAKALRDALARPGVWEDFEQLLSLGGKFQGEGETRSFWAPYVYSAWPDRQDAFESMVVIGADVPLRESNAADAKTIALLSHDIVARAEGPSVNVKTADARTGWVDPRNLRSPVGYRAGFMKSGGRWRMNALVAGD